MLGERVVIVPVTYERYVELQEWLSEHSTDSEASQNERTKFGIAFAVKCIQYACPSEDLTDDEAHAVFRASGGTMGILARKSMAACGHPMEVGTATHLPT